MRVVCISVPTRSACLVRAEQLWRRQIPAISQQSLTFSVRAGTPRSLLLTHIHWLGMPPTLARSLGRYPINDVCVSGRIGIRQALPKCQKSSTDRPLPRSGVLLADGSTWSCRKRMNLLRPRTGPSASHIPPAHRASPAAASRLSAKSAVSMVLSCMGETWRNKARREPLVLVRLIHKAGYSKNGLAVFSVSQISRG